MNPKRSFLCFIFFFLFGVSGCMDYGDKNVDKEKQSIQLTSIERIEIINGTNGERYLVEDTSIYSEVASLINRTVFLSNSSSQDTTGWTRGISICANGKEFLFLPDGVNGYRYEAEGFFNQLDTLVKEQKR